MKNQLRGVLAVSVLVISAIGCENPKPSAAVEVRVVSLPDTTVRNTHYISNRAPLRASPLIKLPVSAQRSGGAVSGEIQILAARVLLKLGWLI